MPAPAYAPSTERSRSTGLLRRLGIVGFVFFLVKGLLWLTVPLALWVLRG